jgi:putative copper export protein
VAVPAIAGVVFTRGGHVYTIENLVHLLHQLAAIIWLGGIPAVNVLQEWIGSGNDQAAQASLPRQSDLYGPAVIPGCRGH